MRKNRFLAIQKLAEQKKGGHDAHGHSHSHHSHHHGHGSISGHGTMQSGHSTLSHALSGHGTLPSHGYDGHRHSHGHGSHSGTLPGSLMSGDLDHAHRQTVSVAIKIDTFF